MSPRAVRRLTRLALVAGAALLGLALLLGGLRLAAAGPPGRMAALWVIDGFPAGDLGRLRASGLSGDILSGFTLARLEVEDADGVWLSVRNLHVVWRPWSLRQRLLELESVEAGETQLLRPPPAPQGAGAGGPPPLAVRIGRLNVVALRLEEGVAGPAAVLTLSGALRVDEEGAAHAAAYLERVDAPGDFVRLDAARGADGALRAQVQAEGAAGGPLAALARAPDAALTLTAALSGDPGAGAGDALLTLDGEIAAGAAFRWADGGFSAEGTAHPARWPLPDAAAEHLASPVVFTVEGRHDHSPVSYEALLETEGAVLRLSPLSPGVFRVEAALDAARVEALSGGAVAARRLGFVGEVQTGDALQGEGRIEAEAFTTAGFAAEWIGGDIALSGPPAALAFRARLETDGARWPEARSQALTGPQAHVEAEGVWEREAQRIGLSRLALRGGAADLLATGSIDLSARRYGAEGAVALTTLSPLDLGFGGRALADFTLDGDFDGTLSLRLAGRAEALSGQAVFDQLGRSASFSAALTRDADGALDLREARIQTRAALVTGRAAAGADGRWRAAGDVALRAAFALGPVEAEGGAAAAFEIADEGRGPVWRAEAFSPALAVGGVTIREPRLRAEGAGLETLAADLRLTGALTALEDAAIDLAGRLERDGEDWLLTGLAGTAGPVAVDGAGQTGAAGGRAGATARWEGGLAGPRVQVRAGARWRTGEAPQIDAEARVTHWFGAGGQRLDSLVATAVGTPENLALRLDAEGAWAEPMQLSAEGRFGLREGGWTAELTPHGMLGPMAVRAAAPLRAESGPEGYAAHGAWTIGGGRFEATARRDAEGFRHTEFSFENLPAAVISLIRARAATDGSFSGGVAWRYGPDGLTGEAELAGHALNPAGSDPGGAIDGVVRARLDAAGLAVTGEAGGGGLTAALALSVASGPVTRLADLREAGGAAVSGRLTLAGPVGALAGFHLPESQRLTGVIDARAEAAGTVAEPVLSGAARFSGGGFTDIRQGLRVTGVEAEAAFAGDSLVLRTLRATDGERGTLTGSGAVSFAGASPSGEVTLQFRGFRAVDRPDLEATASGDANLRIGDGEVLVRGRAVLDRVEARPPQARRDAIIEIEVTEINAPPGTPPPPMRPRPVLWLDYAITAPGRVYVRAPGVDSEWALDLRARGPVAGVKLLGDARLVRGQASMLGRAFAFETGEVRFGGAPEEARMDVTAVRSGADITARVRVHGPVTAPEVALSSEPALPQDEIIARILFDRPAGNLSALEAAQLAAAVSNASGGGAFAAFDRLRALAGVDRLSFRADDEGATVVTGGRYLRDGVYLEVETGVSDVTAATARIEWELRPNLTLLSRLTGSTDAAIALRWRREY